MSCVKIIGAVLIVACGTLWGFYCSYRLRLRERFIVDLIEFLTNLQTNIRYFSDDIQKLLRISAPTSLSFLFDGEYKSFPIFWSSAIERIPKSFSLNNDDLIRLSEFGSALGTTDVEGQINHIQIYKSAFEQSLRNAREDIEKKSRLYKVLGFFTGTVIALMIG